MLISPTRLLLCCILLLSLHGSITCVCGFLVSPPPLSPALLHGDTSFSSLTGRVRVPYSSTPTSSISSSSRTTALNVWWFGGSEQFEGNSSENDDSCELVPVRIERTSPNSRRIFGEIIAPNLTMEQVWAILTDYDRLSIHVPNLVESRIVSSSNANAAGRGRPGDGQYTCRLFQKGAQKIVGFEFGASLTMNMREQVISDKERRINFECVDSFFFQEFDGMWKVVERPSSDGSGGVETTLSYVVEVRPKGPVPVAALEWRIREDVPTNLRAVKRAAAAKSLLLEQQQARQRSLSAAASASTTTTTTSANTAQRAADAAATGTTTRIIRSTNSSASSTPSSLQQQQQQQQKQSRQPSSLAGRQALVGNLRASVIWDRSETMAAYLDK